MVQCAIQQAIYARNYYHAKLIKCKDSGSCNEYRKSRNHVTALIRKHKAKYYNDAITTQIRNPKDMWKTISHVLHSKSKSSSIPDDITADNFNYYFSTVGNNIGNIFDDNVTLPEFHVGPHNSFEFGTIKNTFVCRELCSLKNNLNLDVLGLDGYILSVAAHVLSPSLCFIFNRSLTLGYIPDDWKLARVTPLYKGTGCKTEFEIIDPYLLLLISLKLLKNLLNVI